MKKIIFLLSLVMIAMSCNVSKNAAGLYSLTQCEYSYNSIGGLTLAGVNLQNVNSISSLNPVSAATLAAAFTSKSGSLPLQFTLNLNVKNPGYQTAILNGLKYVLEIDGIEMTTGVVDSRMQIATGQIAQLPISIGFDLKKAMSGESTDAIKNMAYNFAGLGDKPTKVTMKIKPTLEIGGKYFDSPGYIPVSFSYGGK